MDFESTIDARRLLTPAVYEPGSIAANEYTGVEYFADLKNTINQQQVFSETPVIQTQATASKIEKLSPEQYKTVIEAKRAAAIEAGKKRKLAQPAKSKTVIPKIDLPIPPSIVDDGLSAISSESIDALEATIGNFVEAGDEVFESLGSVAFEDLTPARPAVSAKISTAAKAGKQTAAAVAGSATKQVSTQGLATAQAVSRSVAGRLNPTELKMAALGLSLGGLGAGYAYGRTGKRRR